MKIVSDYNIPKPKTEEELKSYYKRVEKIKELEKRGIIIEYA